MSLFPRFSTAEPFEGARLISAITASLFGYDEFILREFSPESLLSAPVSRR